MSNILVVPDLHIPFMHKNTISFIKKALKENKIDEVIFTGDVVDFYTFSRYDKHPDAMNSRQEIEKAKKILKQLVAIIPKAKICIGNHEMRLYKQAAAAGFYSDIVKSLNSILDLPKTWVFGEKFEVDGIIFTHGDGASGRGAAFKLIEKYRKPCVIGHLHGQFTITYLNNGVTTCWACVAGCMVDTDSYAMAYGKYSNDKPICGLTLIKNKVPSYIPLS
jgi:predicted MPP superfamily phosphohydrolase